MDDRVGLSPAQLRRWRAIVAQQSSLHHVVQWMAAASPTPEIVRVVEQDEFTNDMVLAVEPGVFLVYDCT